MRDAAVLVLNAGSSTVKYRVDRAGAAEVAGLVERIGEPSGRLTHRAGDDVEVAERPVPDHAAAVAALLDRVGHVDGLAAVGHRVVHGGAHLVAPTLVDDDVLAALDALAPLAPLHDPPATAAVRAARARFPGLPQVAVFDTAFHHGLPARARRYSLPRALAERYGIRRYGFHGISHGYVARRAAEHLGRPLDRLAMVTLHLGNGASAAAVLGGRSVDTSMGLTPLSGLVMGSRGGDVDPGAVFHLARVAGMDLAEIEDVLTHRSGLVGLAGSGDVRDVRRRAEAGDDDAAETLELYCYRIRCQVGAYAAALGRLDALVFTAGVGEHDPVVRARVGEGLAAFGVRLDPAGNAAVTRPTAPSTVSRPDSDVAVLVVPTDEEHEIARETRLLLDLDAPEHLS